MGFLRFNSVSLAGPGFVVLNGLKVMNIISFLTVIAADILMLIKIQTDSRFFFFQAVHHAIIISLCLFLITSEIPLFPKWFARNWPLLSMQHGFVTLGLVMLALGVETLGMLNETSNSETNLGLAFWRVVMGSGCLMFILGVFNILASFIFRDRIVNVSARQVRALGKPAILDARAMAELQARGKSFASSSVGSDSLRSYKTPKVETSYMTSPPAGAATTAPTYDSTTPSSREMREDTAPNTRRSKRWTKRLTKPILPILPSYHQSNLHSQHSGASSNANNASNSNPLRPGAGGRASPGVASSKYTFSDAGTEQHEMKISGPLGVNPQFAHLPGLIRPDSSYHPYRHAH